MYWEKMEEEDTQKLKINLMHHGENIQKSNERLITAPVKDHQLTFAWKPRKLYNNNTNPSYFDWRK